MQIYYAHHLWKYNTPIEEYEISLIRDFFSEKYLIPIGIKIINPNGAVNQKLTEKEIMRQCLDFVKKSDVTVFSSVNGVIGYGVWQEVNEAFANGKDVYYLFKGTLIQLESFSYKILNGGQNWRMFASIEI